MGLFDRFIKKKGHPLAERMVEEIQRKSSWWDVDLKEIASGKEFLELSREDQSEVAKSLIRLASNLKVADARGKDWQDLRAVNGLLKAVCRRQLSFSDGDLVCFFQWMNEAGYSWSLPYGSATTALENFSKTETPSKELIRQAGAVQKVLIDGDADSRKLSKRIGDSLGLEPELPMSDGDAWAEKAKEDILKLDGELQGGWINLLAHCQLASSGKPTKKWLSRAEELLPDMIPKDEFCERVLEWFALAANPATGPRVVERHGYRHELDPLALVEVNQDILKGLAWFCRLVPGPEIISALSNLCISAFRKIPGVGPRATRLGNACIQTLGSIEGKAALGQLALVKVKVKNRATQNQIAKALQLAADREGVSPEELEEMSVPEYGLTEVGVLTVPFGDYRARVVVKGSHSTELKWIKPDGKEQKSVPAFVKNDHAEELKDLRATNKDIQKMLPVIRERLDNIFLRQKTWPFKIWTERYHDHPLVGSLARKLVWRFGREGEAEDAVWHEGAFVGPGGSPVQMPDDSVENDFPVSLWHPLSGDVEEALQWRNFFEDREIQQPFKQAHREVYVLTEAEEKTDTYSNRYAAHILKQHQFNALCLARDWRNTLRLMVDDEYPPASRYLEEWGIRAEFWIEGIGGDYGTDTTESGTYLYLASDQVRFYPLNASQMSAHAGGGGYGQRWRGGEDSPLRLRDVEPLVFSEIMRDVDLFVGVASVANDPNWSDGGPGGTHRDYWNSYSFGELTATAKTRKEILERLLPRLKIAGVSRISGRFLIVEGKVRTYKIHLGSGNILMEPNDQYLCIVPNASQRRGTDKIFLPFEGDNLMAVILSKAFLLAQDDKIKDRTILSQIGK